MVRRFLIAATLLAAIPAWGDTILLKDGRSFSGSLVRQGDQLSIKTNDGKIVPITADSVQKVVLDTAMSPAEIASSDWARIQVQIRKSTNLTEIIALLQTFVMQHPDTPLTAPAAQSLADFQKMKEDSYVKLRDRWLPKDQAEILTRQADDKAKEALALYTSSKLKDALTAAQACLAIDDQNPTALTVLGLASFKLSDPNAAKGYFLKLTESDPNSALGWNNLAVLTYQSKKENDALGFYLKALQSAMDDREILDNIADAMLNYSGSANVPAYKSLSAVTAQSELRVAAKMAQQGLYRYKASWVTQEQRDRLNNTPGNIGTQLVAAQQQLNSAQSTLTTIDLQIRKNTEAAQRSNTDYANANAVITYNSSRGLTVDPYYFNLRDAATNDLQRTNQQRKALDDQRAQVVDAAGKWSKEVDRLAALAKDANRPGGNGVQRLMEPGDLETPPPPAPVDIPPKVDAAPLPTQAEINALSPPTAAATGQQGQTIRTGSGGTIRILPDNENQGTITVIGPTVIRH